MFLFIFVVITVITLLATIIIIASSLSPLYTCFLLWKLLLWLFLWFFLVAFSVQVSNLYFQFTLYIPLHHLHQPHSSTSSSLYQYKYAINIIFVIVILIIHVLRYTSRLSSKIIRNILENTHKMYGVNKCFVRTH